MKKDKLTKTREKPGGSNVGKYPGVKVFCGPAGGAPKGTYPVNTKKRGKAAIKLAHNAPNPQGIINCVYGHYPSLKAQRESKKSKK
tara:strand:- start:907 stop:1164 length:258 start_codon:yes stop_codon:yes gene_type:complete